VLASFYITTLLIKRIEMIRLHFFYCICDSQEPILHVEVSIVLQEEFDQSKEVFDRREIWRVGREVYDFYVFCCKQMDKKTFHSPVMVPRIIHNNASIGWLMRVNNVHKKIQNFFLISRSQKCICCLNTT
jgi:hypothetical protein